MVDMQLFLWCVGAILAIDLPVWFVTYHFSNEDDFCMRTNFANWAVIFTNLFIVCIIDVFNVLETLHYFQYFP